MICQVISLLQVGIGDIGRGAKQRWQLLHLTRLAESLVRRWLVLKACAGEAWPQVRPARALAAAPVARREAAPRTRLFPLYEPERPLPVWDAAAQASGARSAPRAHVFNPENLKRRCAALSALMTTPEPHIRRMAMWLARAAARGKTRPGRAHPLRVSWPPGSSRRQRRRDPTRQRMLGWLDTLARQAVVRCGSP